MFNNVRSEYIDTINCLFKITESFKAILWIHAIIEPNVSGFISDFALDMG